MSGALRRLRAILQRWRRRDAAPVAASAVEPAEVPPPPGPSKAPDAGTESTALLTISDAPTLAGGPPTAPRVPVPASQAVAAKRIGRYEVLAELGRGGMGVVYKARDPQIGRIVAIKSILPARLLVDDAEFSQYEERFYRESQAAGQLSHPGIVRVHDLIFDDEQPAMVMEFVQGDSLDRLTPGQLPLEKRLDILLQAADALDYAHAQGIVHRDIKPANIMVTREGRVKITDFGIAKVEGSKLTRTGQIVGTPAFMSPEQFVGDAVDGRSDLFSLGSVLYWLCTGQKPFDGKTLTAIGIQLVQQEPIPARQLDPTLPPELDAILSRLLAKDPQKRYATGRQLAADLKALKAGQPLPSGSRAGSS